MALESFHYEPPEKIVGENELRDTSGIENEETRQKDLTWAASMIEEAEFQRLAKRIVNAIKERGSDTAEDYYAIMEDPNIDHDYTVGQLAALKKALENKQ